MACENLRNLLNGDGVCFSNAISAIENGKKFIFNNPNRKTICKVRVDNCLITDQTIKKCDFLFSIQEDNKYYLVELKGKAIDIAIEQIVSTFDIINLKIKAAAQNYTGIIVSSAVPKAANQKFKNFQDKIYRDKKLLIKRKQNHFEEPF
jgi:hypothetical protein